MVLDRVVVVGGSMAGLAAAATLASRAGEVVVVDRHGAPALPPHAGLPHAMLLAGAQVLEELFPGFARLLLDRGATEAGADPDRVPCYWAAAGTVRREQLFRGLTLTRALGSRALVQDVLRARVASLPNVAWALDTVTGVVSRNGAVRGVTLRSGRALEADLVVDAGGRTGGVPLGGDVPEPPTSTVGVDIRYTTFVVERRPEDLSGAAFAVVQNTPSVPRMGIALPMEGGRWQVGFGGYFGEAAPGDPAGARAYAAQALVDPVLAPLLARPFVDGPRRYAFRHGQRRHWDRLDRPIPGYLALGDAVASFNPVYGQGMSSALLQARELGRVVDRYGAGTPLATAAPRAIAKVVDGPWRISTGADFGYDRTSGARPRGQLQVNAYVARVMRAAAVDDHVNLAFSAVQHLLAPPQSLFAPAVVARVLRHGAARRVVSGTSPERRPGTAPAVATPPLPGARRAAAGR